jgi:hypothetical protein
MKIPAAALLAAFCMLATTRGTFASASSPPPPPNCAWCGGPPGPPTPTPVPTVPPEVVAPVAVVTVTMSPTHLQRGHTAKVQIMADTDDAVTSSVSYHSSTKPAVYKGKVGDSGTLTQSFKIPDNAPLGKGELKVTIEGSGDPYTTLITFEVTK